MPFAGGIMMGYQCGMLWGAALAAGAQAYRLHGPGLQAETEAVIAAQKLVGSFRGHTKDEINCLEITNINLQGENQILPVLKFIAKGGPIQCFRMAANYAPAAFNTIKASLSEKHETPASQPVSCGALLAQKMGASEMHVVMAAGFAGGIGLSGGACGALGAAIWLTQMRRPREEGGTSLTEPWVSEMVDQFVESADYEFECAKIAGRKFEDIEAHAGYLQEGGCSKILEDLSRIEV